MEIIIELRDLTSATWFEELKTLVEEAGVADVHLSKIESPPGTFGATRKSKVKGNFPTKRELAIFLSLVSAVYGGKAGSSHANPSSNNSSPMVVIINDGSKRVEIVMPCHADTTEEVKIDTIATALNEISHVPPTIAVLRQGVP